MSRQVGDEAGSARSSPGRYRTTQRETKRTPKPRRLITFGVLCKMDSEFSPCIFLRDENLADIRYLRAKRSKSAIWRSISSRAESEAERMPWMRSLNSSGLEERDKASSSVMSCLL